MSHEPEVLTRRQRMVEESRLWYEVWWSAITHPNSANFDEIGREARVSPNRVFWWIIGASAAAGALSGLTAQIVYDFHGQPVTGPPSIQLIGLGRFLLSFVFQIMGTAIVLPIVMLALAGFIHILAYLLGGRGAFRTFLFIYAASYLPILLVNSILQVIPVVEYVTYVTGFYATILLIYATRSAYSLRTGRALAVSVLVSVVIIAGGTLLAAAVN